MPAYEVLSVSFSDTYVAAVWKLLTSLLWNVFRQTCLVGFGYAYLLFARHAAHRYQTCKYRTLGPSVWLDVASSPSDQTSSIPDDFTGITKGCI